MKLKMFSITAKISLDTSLVIYATSLEEAVAKSSTLDIHDFVKILGDHNDSETIVRGAYLCD